MDEAQILERVKRLRRLRQVREQNKVIAEGRRSSYSSSICKDKQRKEFMLRNRIVEKTVCHRKQAFDYYKNALTASGQSYRDACESAANLMTKLNTLQDNIPSKNLIVAIRSQRAREHILKGIHRNEERQKRMNVLRTKIEFSKEERNGARWIYESSFARKDAEDVLKANNRGFHSATIQAQTDGFSPYLYERGPLIVRATITKHDFGSLEENGIGNGAHAIDLSGDAETPPVNNHIFHNHRQKNGIVSKDSNITSKKMFKAVLNQLLWNSTTVRRAGEAREITLTKQLSRTFEDDLAVLYSIDRQGKRSMRIRSLDTISSLSS